MCYTLVFFFVEMMEMNWTHTYNTAPGDNALPVFRTPLQAAHGYVSCSGDGRAGYCVNVGVYFSVVGEGS